MRLLEQLRQQSHARRRAVAFGLAGGITGVIFIVWAVAFFASIERTSRDVAQAGEAFGGFGSLLSSLQETGANIQQNAQVVREQIEYLSTQPDSAQSDPEESDIVVEGNAQTEAEETITPAETEAGQPEAPSKDAQEEPSVERTPEGIEIIRVGN